MRLQNTSGMEMSKGLFAALAACVVLSACGGGGESAPSAPSASNYNGNWSMRYSGDDSGSCRVSIATSASTSHSNVRATCSPSTSFDSFTVDGSVDANGRVTGGPIIGDGFYFDGRMSGNSGSGIWRITVGKREFSGNWTASKS